MFATYLVRLRGDEQWADYGEMWWDHADRLGEMDPRVGGWKLHMTHFADQDGTRLDWGAVLYPATKERLADIYADTDSATMVADLDGNGSYALAVVELW